MVCQTARRFKGLARRFLRSCVSGCAVARGFLVSAPPVSASWKPFPGAIIPTYSIVIAHVNDGVTPGEFVAASGGLLIVQGVGATVGPIVAVSAMRLPSVDCRLPSSRPSV